MLVAGALRNSAQRAAIRPHVSAADVDPPGTTSRQRAGSLEKAVVPKALEPILTRIGINGSMFIDLVWNFKKYFGRGNSAGSPNRLKENAESRGRKFSHGQRSAANCFVAID